ncbi:MAG: TIM barrel protein, partial [Candidatus Brocadiia bacterium]
PKGVRVALENHGGLSSTGAEMLRLLDLADHPNVFANYDGGNFALHGEDPVSAYLLLRGDIGYTHWKGVCANGDELTACALGEGIIDWTPVVNGLLADAYDGYWTLELPEGEGMEAALKRSMEYLREVTGR